MGEAVESLFQCLEGISDPRDPRGVRFPFQGILRLTVLGLVSGQTTMAHIALFGEKQWEKIKEPQGFTRDKPPHATTISRTLAGVSFDELRQAMLRWVGSLVKDQPLRTSVDGKWAKQSTDAAGNPLAMVNVLAHELKLCLTQWPMSEKRHEPTVLQAHLGELFEHYPGLEVLTMDALYAQRGLCEAIVSYGRDYLVRIKGNQPTTLEALKDGFPLGELGEPAAYTVEKKRAASRVDACGSTPS